MPSTEPIFADLAKILPHITAIRHDLHQHPELGYEETYTSQLVSRELTRLNIPHQTGLAGGTGILATLGPPTGRCVALRTDMDALPVTESTGLPYASQTPGKMHACGHDGHTAILLGVAAVLKARESSLTGTVKLLFQPAEEGGRGADRMCIDGVLENPKVQAIFGLHGWPGLKVGLVASRPGPLLAGVDHFTITLTGKGTHAAAPHDGIDPIPCAASLVLALQTISSRELDAAEPFVLTIAQFHAGSTFNVISDTATLSGTLRTLSIAQRERAIAALERLTTHIAAAHRCSSKVRFTEQTPPTTNTPELAAFVQQTAESVLGQNRYFTAPRPAMWGEDFSFYLQRIPGCFFVLGVQPHDRDSHPMLHNSNYDFTDAALPIGIQMLSTLAMNFLSRPTP